jgi:uncharacterized membrane protein
MTRESYPKVLNRETNTSMSRWGGVRGVVRNPRAIIENLRGSLLLVPGASVIAAVLVALALTQPRWAPQDADSPFFGGGPASAQGLLQAITTAVITATTLTFSLTVVTLQLASSQFSPRLLRGFIRDRGTKTVLSIMLATAAYSLVVLRSIRSVDDPGGPFVPQIAVTGAVVMAMATIGALVYFLDHVTTEIRVETMLKNARDATCSTIERVYPATVAQGCTGPPRPESGVFTQLAGTSGFVQAADVEALTQLAIQHDVNIRLMARVGDAVVEGTPLAHAWSSSDARSPLGSGDLDEGVNQLLTVGFERTAAQDVAFGFRQLTDVASRALSPGINDPTTAEHAVSHLAHLLCLLAPRPMDDSCGRDDSGHVRALLPRHHFEDLLDQAITPLRLYGSGHPQVVSAVLRMLVQIHDLCRDQHRREAVREHARRVMDAARSDLRDPTDLNRLHSLAESLVTPDAPRS